MIMKKYNRTNFYNQMQVKSDDSNDISEIDLVNSYFYLFKTTVTPRRYQIDRYTECRPDKISSYVYNDTTFWWIIMKYNDIMDVFTELPTGMILSIPDMYDIQNWYSAVKDMKLKDQKLSSDKSLGDL